MGSEINTIGGIGGMGAKQMNSINQRSNFIGDDYSMGEELRDFVAPQGSGNNNNNTAN
jgi:hypothetical protein